MCVRACVCKCVMVCVYVRSCVFDCRWNACFPLLFCILTKMHTQCQYVFEGAFSFDCTSSFISWLASAHLIHRIRRRRIWWKWNHIVASLTHIELSDKVCGITYSFVHNYVFRLYCLYLSIDVHWGRCDFGRA